MKANGPLPIAVSSLWNTHLEGRRMLLHGKLAMVTALARIGQLPDASLDATLATLVVLYRKNNLKADSIYHCLSSTGFRFRFGREGWSGAAVFNSFAIRSVQVFRRRKHVFTASSSLIQFLK